MSLHLFTHFQTTAGPAPSRFRKFAQASRVQTDFRRLLERIHQRLYPETLPVLASFWLKTVYCSGYTREEWRALDRFLKHSIDDFEESALQRQALADIRSWLGNSGRLTRKLPAPERRAGLMRRPALSAETLVPYTIRLLNTWLPQEIARLLIEDPEEYGPGSGGIPVLATGRALERLVLRESLPAPSLELMLDPALVSAQSVYPADLEMLRDVILFLLGRTGGVPPAILPAAYVGTPRDVRISGGDPEGIRRAYLVEGTGGEELHVPIQAEQVMQILGEPPLGIGSLVVTADGRWWEARRLQHGEEDRIVYRPMGRPRIDYSADHARLRVPWPAPRFDWSGTVHFSNVLEVFGRQWTVARWEKDGAHAWLHLIFSQPIPVTLAPPSNGSGFRRCLPASTDLAWAELETALDASVVLNREDSIEHLQRTELVPLGRVLFGFSRLALSRRQPDVEAVESELKRIRFFLGGLDSSYGLIPWRILPQTVREALLRRRLPAGLADLMHQCFGAMPAASGDRSLRSRLSFGIV